MPGQSDTVQGIALTVVAPPNAAEVIEVDASGTDLQEAGTCSHHDSLKAGCLTQSRGDNLTFLATRGGTTVTKIAEVNCP